MQAHEILGIEPGASLDEIQDAYRARVKEHHPDRGGSDGDFVRVREAYETLLEQLLDSVDGASARSNGDETSWEDLRDEVVRERDEELARHLEDLLSELRQPAGHENNGRFLVSALFTLACAVGAATVHAVESGSEGLLAWGLSFLLLLTMMGFVGALAAMVGASRATSGGTIYRCVVAALTIAVLCSGFIVKQFAGDREEKRPLSRIRTLSLTRK